jgi:hypothetical protein
MFVFDDIPPLNDPPKKSLFERFQKYRENNLNADKVKEITFYGNGILYFQADQGYKSFGQALSKYLSNNPTQKVISIAPYDDVNGVVTGITVGYFVIVEQKVDK